MAYVNVFHRRNTKHIRYKQRGVAFNKKRNVIFNGKWIGESLMHINLKLFHYAYVFAHEIDECINNNVTYRV